ncbi:MAG: hypothetical protein LBJ00_15740 [Planctomycetaceae bacterium]|jgi:hypothetical protein|nr:hypothetical protein [Planctomycetaceae bacterium]
MSKAIFIIFSVLFLFSATIFCAEKPLPGQLPRHIRSGGTIFRTLFDKSSDLDEDAWPDSWTRKREVDRNIQFPDYIDIRIVEYHSQFGNNSLRMSVEGGSAAVFSPKIKVRRGMCYKVSAFVSTENIVFDDVFILASFYGKNGGEPIVTVRSESIKRSEGWRKLEIGTFQADNDKIDSVSVGLLTTQGERRDFNAKVYFTNIEIKESPNIKLSMPNDHHIFTDKSGIEVSCVMTGFDPDQDKIKFIIEDPFGRLVASREVEMIIGNRPASQFVVPKNDRWSVFEGRATWSNLPINSVGFYRIRVETPKYYKDSLRLPTDIFFEDSLRDTVPLTFVVIERSAVVQDGVFGWNLDGWNLNEIYDRRLQLSLSGISKLKIPAWIAGSETERRQQFLKINETFTPLGMQVIGLLSPVPREIQDRIKIGNVNAASIFAIPTTTWTEAIQPVIQENSLLVKNWQLTGDEDLSVINVPNFARRFQEVRRSFDRRELGLGVGVAWDWTQSLPSLAQPVNTTSTTSAATKNAERNSNPRDFLSLYVSDQMTADDLERNLLAVSNDNVRKFISLSLLSGGAYDLSSRVTDVVRKMVAGKIAGADAVFLSQPVSEQNGVLNSDATPNEIFPAWRTTSILLSGREYLGQVKLPNRSQNYNFVDHFGGDAVMVIWNDSATAELPVVETLYLGEDVEIIDVWGKRVVAELLGREQKIVVGQIPIFVRGLDADIVRMRLGFKLGREVIPSRINNEEQIPLTFVNNTNLPANVQFSVVEPRTDAWRIKSAEPLVLDSGGTGNSSFGIALNPQSETGLQKFKIDVATVGAMPRRFAIYDDIYVGERDVRLEFSSRMNRAGNIEVTQAFINDGERERSYVCRLRVRGREYLQTFIIRQGFGRVEYTYVIPNGHELLRTGVREMTIHATPLPTDPTSQPMRYIIPLLYRSR